MSGPTRADYTGRLLHVVFVEQVRRRYARFTKPDGTEVTADMQAQQRRDGFIPRLERLATALEPLLMQIATTQGGEPLTTGDPLFKQHRRVVDLAEAVGLSADAYELSVAVALPSPLSDAERERLHARARKAWKKT